MIAHDKQVLISDYNTNIIKFNKFEKTHALRYRNSMICIKNCIISAHYIHSLLNALRGERLFGQCRNKKNLQKILIKCELHAIKTVQFLTSYINDCCLLGVPVWI